MGFRRLPFPPGRMRLSEKELGLPAGLCARAEEAFLDPCAGRRGLWGLPAPAPPSREPAVPLPLRPWAHGARPWLCPPPKDLCASRLRCSPRQRLSVQPGSVWPQTGIEKPNVCCGHFACVCLVLIPNSSHVVKIMSGGIT